MSKQSCARCRWYAHGVCSAWGEPVEPHADCAGFQPAGCETCRHWLGGWYDNCAINLEGECAAGSFEAWEARED